MYCTRHIVLVYEFLATNSTLQQQQVGNPQTQPCNVSLQALGAKQCCKTDIFRKIDETKHNLHYRVFWAGVCTSCDDPRSSGSIWSRTCREFGSRAYNRFGRRPESPFFTFPLGGKIHYKQKRL